MIHVTSLLDMMSTSSQKCIYYKSIACFGALQGQMIKYYMSGLIFNLVYWFATLLLKFEICPNQGYYRN